MATASLLPSLLAVMVASPNPTAATDPAVPVATAAFVELKATGRPVIVLLNASFNSSVLAIDPVPMIESDTVESTTLATGFSIRAANAGDVLMPVVAVMFTVTGPAAAAMPVMLNDACPDPFVVADGVTVARDGLADAKVTVRPGSGALAASRTVATPERLPGAMTESGVTVSPTLAAAASTLMVAVPAVPPIVAVIVAVPASNACAVTSPLASTVATALLLLQDVMRPPNATPVIALPAESFGTAVSCCVSGAVSVAVEGETSTVLTATRSTVTVDEPVMPSTTASIRAVPGATPVTTPVDGSTVAAERLFDDQVAVRPLMTVPPEDFAVKLKERAYGAPAWTVAVGPGDTSTVLTAAAET